MLRITTARAFTTSNGNRILHKWSEPLVFLTCSLPKCASRHKGKHLFDISTSKSRPTLKCFVHFHFHMCFPPQQRAIFPQPILPRVLRTRRVLTLLTCKCASRHNGVHFFDIATYKRGPSMRCFDTFYFKMCFLHNSVPFLISHLASYLRARRFSEPTFRPSLSEFLPGSASSWLCFSICLYCRKFSFQTSFDDLVFLLKCLLYLTLQSPRLKS